MPSVVGTVKEKGDKNGAPFVVLQKAMADSEGKTAKAWVNRDYPGLVPSVGDTGKLTYSEEQRGDYKMKRLEAWEPQPIPASGNSVGNSSPNGSAAQSEKQFVGREPGVNDRWTAARWALSAAVDVLGAGKTVAEYTALADSFLEASLALAESLAAKKGEAAGPDAW